MSADPYSPLRALYSNDKNMPILSYPNSLGNSRQGHFISFSVLVPTKATYQETGVLSSFRMIDPSSRSHFDAISQVQNTLNSAASTASSAISSFDSAVKSVTSVVGTVAGVANKVIGTATQVAGVGASVVGVVSGAKSIITGGLAAGSPLTALSGVTTGITNLSNVASAATSIPGMSNFLNDPMKTASSAFDSIKSFLNDPAKAFSTDGTNSSQQGEDQTKGPVFSPSSMQPTGYINLYMPDTISMQQHASYKDLNMTEATGKVGALYAGVNSGGDIANSAESIANGYKGNGNEGFLKSAIRTSKEVNTPPIVAEGLAGALGKLGAIKNSTDVAQYWMKQEGNAINPQFEVVFSAMDFRTFQFDFTFTPKSSTEAETVRDIIKLFRKHSAPNIHNSGGGRYFDVPAVFQIEYMHLDKRNENLHKFAPCVLQSIVVDYAPEVGWVTYTDGMPVKTRLTLMFKETEILTRDKIDQGY
jgi:hypothetical protein